MPPAAKRRAETDSRRHMAKRHVSPNERWLHLSSAENDLKSTIQASLFVISAMSPHGKCRVETGSRRCKAKRQATPAVGGGRDNQYQTMEARRPRQ